MKHLYLLLIIPALAWAEPATVIRATDLKQAPAGEGWVRMLALRFGGAGTPKPGASGVSQLFNVSRTGTSGTQVTTGVRGLDADQIAAAQPNPAELAKLEKFAADASAAEKFAGQGKLSRTSVEYPK